jgi:hypothetical protein
MIFVLDVGGDIAPPMGAATKLSVVGGGTKPLVCGGTKLICGGRLVGGGTKLAPIGGGT